jgi:hypothetical protein
MGANKEALQDGLSDFAKGGYTGDINDFTTLMKTNKAAREDAFKDFTSKGYTGDRNDFAILMGASTGGGGSKKVKKEGVVTPKKIPLFKSPEYINRHDKDKDGFYDHTQTEVKPKENTKEEPETEAGRLLNRVNDNIVHKDKAGNLSKEVEEPKMLGEEDVTKDIGWLENKENRMKNHIEKRYKDFGFDFDIIDEDGRHDTIVAKAKDGSEFKILTGGEYDNQLASFHKWAMNSLKDGEAQDEDDRGEGDVLITKEATEDGVSKITTNDLTGEDFKNEHEARQNTSIEEWMELMGEDWDIGFVESQIDAFSALGSEVKSIWKSGWRGFGTAEEHMEKIKKDKARLLQARYHTWRDKYSTDTFGELEEKPITTEQEYIDKYNQKDLQNGGTSKDWDNEERNEQILSEYHAERNEAIKLKDPKLIKKYFGIDIPKEELDKMDPSKLSEYLGQSEKSGYELKSPEYIGGFSKDEYSIIAGDNEIDNAEFRDWYNTQADLVEKGKLIYDDPSLSGSLKMHGVSEFDHEGEFDIGSDFVINDYKKQVMAKWLVHKQGIIQSRAEKFKNRGLGAIMSELNDSNDKAVDAHDNYQNAVGELEKMQMQFEDGTLEQSQENVDIYNGILDDAELHAKSYNELVDNTNALWTDENKKLIAEYTDSQADVTKLQQTRLNFLENTEYGKEYAQKIKDQKQADERHWLGETGVSIANWFPNTAVGIVNLSSYLIHKTGYGKNAESLAASNLYFNTWAEERANFTTSSVPVVDEFGNVNYSRILPSVTTTILDMLEMIYISKGVGGVLKAGAKTTGKLMTKIPRIGASVTSYIAPKVAAVIPKVSAAMGSIPVLLPANLEAAFAQVNGTTFTYEDAIKYAQTQTLTEALIEMINPDITYTKGISIAGKGGKEALEMLMKEPQLALIAALKSVAPEVAEELLQNFTTGLTSKMYNDEFGTNFVLPDANSYKETAILTLFSTLGMRGLTGNLTRLDKTGIYRAASQDFPLFMQSLNEAMVAGKITEEQGKKMKQDVENFILVSGDINDMLFDEEGTPIVTESQANRLIEKITHQRALQAQLEVDPNGPMAETIKKELANVEEAINSERNMIKSENSQSELMWSEGRIKHLKTELANNKKKVKSGLKTDITPAKEQEMNEEIAKLRERSKVLKASSPEYSIAGTAYNTKEEFLEAIKKAKNAMRNPKNRKNLNIRVKDDFQAEMDAYNILGPKYSPKGVKDRVMMTNKEAIEAQDFIGERSETELREGLNKELSKPKSKQNEQSIQEYKDALKYLDLKSKNYTFGKPGFLVQPTLMSESALQDVGLERNLATTQKAIDQIGMQRDVVNTMEEAIEKYGEIVEGANGFFTTTYNDKGEVTGYVQVVIKDEAIKKGARSTGSHEFLHGVTFGIINGPIRKVTRPDGTPVWVKMSPEGVKLIKGFLKLLPQEQVDILDKKLEDGGYKYDADGNELAFEEYAEEYLEMYSDAVIIDKTIPIDTPKAKSVFKRIIDYFNSVFKKFLQNGKEEDIDTTNIDIKSPEDLLGFLKSYNSQIMSEKIGTQIIELGKRSVVAQQDAIREDSENADYQDFLDKQFAEETNNIMKSNSKITRADAKKAAIKKLRPGMMSKSKALDDKKKQDLFSKTNKTLSESLKPYGLKGDFDSNNKDHLALWEKLTVRDKRFIGYTLGKIWRPYAQNKLWEKYSRIPNYDLFEAEILDVLTTGMQVGENGLPFVVSTWDPSKRKLTSHIWDLLPKRIYHVITNVPQFAGFGKTIDENFSEDINDRLKEETRPKKNILKFDKVKNKVNELMDVIDIAPIGKNTFKTVDEYTGKVAEIIFDIPAEKATKGNKNLSHKTKVVNGMMELSQAGKIQDFFRVGDNLENLVKIMVPENVTSKTADISEVGENIDVARDIYGRSIGLKGKVLEYFFDKTEKRSQGLTTQPNVWELKPEFKKPSKETLEQLRADLGITPQGDANISDRAFNGQLLKGIAEYQAYQTALSITQRKLDAIKQEAATKEEKSAISQDIANVTAAQSRFAFSKNSKYSGEIIEGWDAFSQLAKNPDFKGNIKVAIREIYGEGLSAESIGTIEGLAKKYLDSFNDIGDIVEHF